MKINISIVEDHPVVTEGLKNIFRNEERIHIKHTWENADSFLEHLEKNKTPDFDVLLLDILLPDQNGDVVTRFLQKHYPDIRILSMSVLESAISANTMLRLGAKGYILKSSTQEEWVNAVISVYQNNIYIEPTLGKEMEELGKERTKEASISTTITPREKEVLQEIVNGLSKKDIAQKLNISINTVKQYQYNLSLKLEVQNARALVRHALRTGLAQ